MNNIASFHGREEVIITISYNKLSGAKSGLSQYPFRGEGRTPPHSII